MARRSQTRDDAGEVTPRLPRWEELRRQGRAPDAELLCSDRPELAAEVARRIRIFKAGEEALGLSPETISQPATRADRAAPTAPPGFVLGERLGAGGMGVV